MDGIRVTAGQPVTLPDRSLLEIGKDPKETGLAVYSFRFHKNVKVKSSILRYLYNHQHFTTIRDIIENAYAYAYNNCTHKFIISQSLILYQSYLNIRCLQVQKVSDLIWM